MIRSLGHNHLRQQAGSGRALLDWLRWLGRRLHGAGAHLFLADILDDGQLRRNAFIALAGLFTNGPQILLASGAVFVRIRHIVHDPLALERPRTTLTTARPSLP